MLVTCLNTKSSPSIIIGQNFISNNASYAPLTKESQCYLYRYGGFYLRGVWN